MSTFAVVTRESEAPFWSGLGAFELALITEFSDLRIVGKLRAPVAALEWVRGDDVTSARMDGHINEAMTAIYLKGEDRLVYETALWLQSAVGDGVLMWDWQGIPFALSRLGSVDALIAAVQTNDESLDYRARVTFADAD